MTTRAAHFIFRSNAIAALVMQVAVLAALAADGVSWGSARAQDATVRAPAGVSGTGTTQTRRFVIRFVTESEFPPFNYYDDEGVLAGFNVDLARAICLEANAACDIKVRPWEELLPALGEGEADAVIAAHQISAVTLTDVDFSDRYFYTPGRFAGRTGEGEVEINSDGLDGMSIGVAKGTAHEAFVRAFFRDSDVVAFENPELAREALQQKSVDLIFGDAISLAFWLNGSLSRQCCEFKGEAFLEPKYFGDGIAIAVPRDDPQIKALINESLKRVRQSGRFQELVERYFPLRIF